MNTDLDVLLFLVSAERLQANSHTHGLKNNYNFIMQIL